MNKTPIYYPLLLGVALAIGVLLGISINNGYTGLDWFNNTSNTNKHKLNQLIDIIDQRYVDQVNTDSIVDIAVNGILSSLDPHSVYIPESSMARVTDNVRGDFVGIGIRFFVLQDTISVIGVMDDGPSLKAGIRSGDKILYADGHSLHGDHVDSIQWLKGDPGSKVTLGVLRPGHTQVVDLKVTRDHVSIKSIDAAYMLSDRLGYIKVNRFAIATQIEFDQALERLIQLNASELVLDLRDNPGGVLTSAIAMADHFLKKDQLILSQKNRQNKLNKTYATKNGYFEDKKVYVLINEHSASASEVVAGALQDNDIGIVVGRRSFGKGLVQQEMPLADGSAVRITVSRYYTPTGRSIQRPYNNGNDRYYNDYIDRYDRGELHDSIQMSVNDSLKYTTPLGKVVYGGGGIIPDVFVPVSQNYVLQSLDYSFKNGIADRFVNQYLQHDGLHLRHLSQDEFINDYQVPEIVLQNFVSYLDSLNTYISLSGYRDQVALVIKSTIAGQLFNDQLKTKLINQQDVMIKRVLELNNIKPY